MKKDAPDEDIGFEIFTDTIRRTIGKDSRAAILSKVYLTSGTYHRLADMIRIGWHPRFKKLMEDLIKAP